jgi:hypothetical protein
MADYHLKVRSVTPRGSGLEKAIDDAWEEYKNANGGAPNYPLTVQIQVEGNNPINSYIILLHQ